MRFGGTDGKRVLGALVMTAALGAAGCSFSYSSDSSSKSSKSSSGGDAKKSDEKKAYQDDVRDYTYAYVEKRDAAAADRNAFARGLGDVARRHGLTDWEDDLATFEAIGAGLAKADVAAGTLPTFERDLGGADATRSAAIRRGYDAYRAS